MEILKDKEWFMPCRLGAGVDGFFTRIFKATNQRETGRKREAVSDVL